MTGVLHKNDVDYQVAKDLACEVITEEAFEPVGEAAYRKALEEMKKCTEVICCINEFGTMNRGNERLMDEAEKMGKLCKKSF